MNYEPYYSEGWKNNEEGGTPITAASLNHVDDGLLDHDEDLQNIFGDMATMEESETASQSYAVGDYLILDGLFYKVTTAISSGGTIAPGTNCEQTTVSDELNELNSKFAEQPNAGFHNSIYRGKYLGSSVTAKQWAEIEAGTFMDLFIGDYWTIGSVNWRIAGFDYWLRHGDTECTKHHIVIVPDSNLLTGDGSTTHWMNKTDITTGAIVGSDWYTGANGNNGKAQCRTKIQSAFGSGHILTHREYLKNAVTNGYESAGEWYNSDVEMMTERMVYGCNVFSNVVNGTNVPASQTVGTSQLPLFALDHSRICNRAAWWLRDVASATAFAYVFGSGSGGIYNASSAWGGVRPAFGICV